MELVTVQTIIDFFESSIINRTPISPDLWLDGALKLNVLIGTEYDILASLERRCAEIEVVYIRNDMPSVKAKTFLKTHDEYELLQKQRTRVKQIEEFIRLAKKHATLLSDNMRNSINS